jgi:hypothetical protein
MHASIACLLLYEDYVWVSLENAMKTKQSKAKLVISSVNKPAGKMLRLKHVHPPSTTGTTPVRKNWKVDVHAVSTTGSVC